jgi:peptide/nickel transport system ATP-binding protein
MTLLQVEHLSVVNRQGIALVDDVSFQLNAGEMLGLVGESGSGKTVSCRAVMRLLPPDALRIAGGEVRLQGQNILAMTERQMAKIGGREIGMIFQNPSSHLNPIMTIGAQIAESRRLHFGVSAREAMADAIELLRKVGIPDPAQRVKNYPHEFSGGMRQRAMIAVALAPEPKVLIADEPTTALDVTVQLQILRLLMSLRDTLGVAIVMITHDLGVVAQTCDRIAVMYGGRLCETGGKHQVLAGALHPYTQGLMDCQPASEGGHARLVTIDGQPPVAEHFPTGCRFHPRCQRATHDCEAQQPLMRAAVTQATHHAACHHPFAHLQTLEAPC